MYLFCYRMRKENWSIFFNATPVPFATACNGSSAMWNGIPILSVNRLSNPLNKAPPPANQIPLRTISAYNSGGVCSNAFNTAASIFEIDFSIQ